MVVLLKYNQALLIDLEARLATWGKMSKLGDIFLKMVRIQKGGTFLLTGFNMSGLVFDDLR